jgi:hypothetical protein
VQGPTRRITAPSLGSIFDKWVIAGAHFGRTDRFSNHTGDH